VFDKAVERIETITPPEVPANIVFGGKDMQTLFMTARTGSMRSRPASRASGHNES
jgi:sugar lactone lactonase YvrE